MIGEYRTPSPQSVTTRTWQPAIGALIKTKHGANKERWQQVVKDVALIPLLPQVIVKTKADTLLKAWINGHLKAWANRLVAAQTLAGGGISKSMWRIPQFGRVGCRGAAMRTGQEPLQATRPTAGKLDSGDDFFTLLWSVQVLPPEKTHRQLRITS